MSIQLMQQAICYMEEHICENISYSDVAKSVHMSGCNFHRAFSFFAIPWRNAQTGKTQTDDTDYEIYYENGESGLFCELWVPVKQS